MRYNHWLVPLAVISWLALGPLQAAVLPIANVNGLVSQYDQPFLNSGDTCTSDTITFGPKKGLSRVCHAPPGGVLTPDTCDATISSGDSESTIESKLNTTTDTDSDGDIVVCIEPATYTTNQIDITANGSSSVPRWLIYKRSGDTDDDPWNMSAANKAIFSDMEVLGDFWRFHRITFNGGNRSADFIELGRDSNNNIWNRVLLETTVQGLKNRGTDNILQNSVVRSTTKNPGSDQHCIGGNSGTPRFIIVNNEIYDCAGDAIQTNSSSPCVDCVFENNDLYQTTAMYCDADGTPNVNGDFSAGEQGFDFKEGGNAAGDHLIAINNRIWGMRKTDTSCGSTGSSGEGIIVNGDPGRSHVLVENNIIFNGPSCIGINAGEYDNVSIIGNLCYNMIGQAPAFGGRQCFPANNGEQSEVYLNTCIDAQDNWSKINIVDGDWRCNVVIDAGLHINSLASGEEMDYNTYYGVSGTKLDTNFVDKTLTTRTNNTVVALNDLMRTVSTPPEDGTAGDFIYAAIQAGTTAGSTPTFTNRLNNVTKDGTVFWRSIRGPLKWRRKLRTVPAGEVFYIPYGRAVPDLSAALAEACPSGIETDACGSRISPTIGVDNQACEDLNPINIMGTPR